MLRETFLHYLHKAMFYVNEQAPFPGRGRLQKLLPRLVPAATKPIVLNTLYDFKMQIDPVNDKGVERTLYHTGTYELGTLHIFKHLLNEGDVFFDIGSNIGLMSLFASVQVGATGAVHCFEPEPDTFRILAHNVAINGFGNLRLNNLALGSEQKEGIIYANMDINRGASSIVKADGSAGKKIVIDTLDHYISQHNPGLIKLMKIDVEGYELEMLKGATTLLQSEQAPIICIEYSKLNEHVGAVDDVYDFLVSINQYRIFRFVQWKEKISPLREVLDKDDMPEHDNVFCFLPSHLEHADRSIFAKA